MADNVKATFDDGKVKELLVAQRLVIAQGIFDAVDDIKDYARRMCSMRDEHVTGQGNSSMSDLLARLNALTAVLGE